MVVSMILVVVGILAVVVTQFLSAPQKLDRRVQKARDTERNVGNRIVKALHLRIVGEMYVILSEHREWGKGYEITLKHHS